MLTPRSTLVRPYQHHRRVGRRVVHGRQIAVAIAASQRGFTGIMSGHDLFSGYIYYILEIYTILVLE